MTYTYLVTISCQQKQLFISYLNLYNIIMWLKLSIPQLHIRLDVFETSGKYKQLHYHAIVEVPSKFVYRPYTKYGDSRYCRSYRIQWSKVHNLRNAVRYLQKDLQDRTQEDILLYNYYSIYRFNEIELKVL